MLTKKKSAFVHEEPKLQLFQPKPAAAKSAATASSASAGGILPAPAADANGRVVPAAASSTSAPGSAAAITTTATSTTTVIESSAFRVPLGYWRFQGTALRRISANTKYRINGEIGPALRPQLPLQLEFGLTGFQTKKDQQAWREKYGCSLYKVPPHWLYDFAHVRVSVRGIDGGEVAAFPGSVAKGLLPLVFWGLVLSEADGS